MKISEINSKNFEYLASQCHNLCSLKGVFGVQKSKSKSIVAKEIKLSCITDLGFNQVSLPKSSIGVGIRIQIYLLIFQLLKSSKLIVPFRVQWMRMKVKCNNIYLALLHKAPSTHCSSSYKIRMLKILNTVNKPWNAYSEMESVFGNLNMHKIKYQNSVPFWSDAHTSGKTFEMWRYPLACDTVKIAGLPIQNRKNP